MMAQSGKGPGFFQGAIFSIKSERTSNQWPTSVTNFSRLPSKQAALFFLWALRPHHEQDMDLCSPLCQRVFGFFVRGSWNPLPAGIGAASAGKLTERAQAPRWSFIDVALLDGVTFCGNQRAGLCATAILCSWSVIFRNGELSCLMDRHHSRCVPWSLV